MSRFHPQPPFYIEMFFATAGQSPLSSHRKNRADAGGRPSHGDAAGSPASGEAWNDI